MEAHSTGFTRSHGDPQPNVVLQMSREERERVIASLKHLVEELRAEGLIQRDLPHVETAEELIRTLENA